VVNLLYDYDFGADFNYNDVSGTISLARDDPESSADSGAEDRCGWQRRGWRAISAATGSAGYLCGMERYGSRVHQRPDLRLNGGYIPFAKTKRADGLSDPRLSLEERYGTHDAYVAKVKAAAAKSVAEHFLYQEDADRLVAQAAPATS